jgi:hypothetical protein
LIIDPFDKDNNPGKTLKKGKLEISVYRKAMIKGVKDLKKGNFIY